MNKEWWTQSTLSRKMKEEQQDSKSDKREVDGD